MCFLSQSIAREKKKAEHHQMFRQKNMLEKKLAGPYVVGNEGSFIPNIPM